MILRRYIAIGAMALGLTGLSWIAWAQHDHGAQAEGQNMEGMREGMMEHAMPMHESMGEHGGMGMMEMSPAMMQRHKLLMQAEINNGDPQALLALKDKLDLNEDQVGQLRSILQDARSQSLNVLDAKQRQKLDDIPTSPTSMGMAMMHMHQKMMKMHGHDSDSMMMCPMMDMMGEGEAGQGSTDHEAHH